MAPQKDVEDLREQYMGGGNRFERHLGGRIETQHM